MAPATKATQKRLDATVSAFNARYAASDQWGQERWNNMLYPALVKPTTYCAVVNLYALEESQAKGLLLGDGSSELQKVILHNESWVDNKVTDEGQVAELLCYERVLSTRSGGVAISAGTKGNSAMPFPVPRPIASSQDQLYTHWNMDAASVLAANILDVQPGDRVLDMCAAPGGKSVVLAQKLFPQYYHTHLSQPPAQKVSEQSCLVVNELDTVRQKRLLANMKAYLPSHLFPTPETPQAPLMVLNKDLSTKGAVSMLPYGAGSYDKVLIDAPCSSERHIIHAYEKAKASGQAAEEMMNWKASHVASLVKIQAGLLKTALRAVKIGGRVVYATCALGWEENDGVIDKVLDQLKVDRKKARREGHSSENWDVEFELGSKGTKSVAEDSVLSKVTEGTKYGRIALPDIGGWGPLYFAVIVKIDKAKKTKTKQDTNGEV